MISLAKKSRVASRSCMQCRGRRHQETVCVHRGTAEGKTQMSPINVDRGHPASLSIKRFSTIVKPSYMPRSGQRSVHPPRPLTSCSTADASLSVARCAERSVISNVPVASDDPDSGCQYTSSRIAASSRSTIRLTSRDVHSCGACRPRRLRINRCPAMDIIGSENLRSSRQRWGDCVAVYAQELEKVSWILVAIHEQTGARDRE